MKFFLVNSDFRPPLRLSTPSRRKHNGSPPAACSWLSPTQRSAVQLSSAQLSVAPSNMLLPIPGRLLPLGPGSSLGPLESYSLHAKLHTLELFMSYKQCTEKSTELIVLYHLRSVFSFPFCTYGSLGEYIEFPLFFTDKISELQIHDFTAP